MTNGRSTGRPSSSRQKIPDVPGSLSGSKAEPQTAPKSMRHAHADETFRRKALILVRKSGAGEGIRTLDPNLGKVVLYP